MRAGRKCKAAAAKGKKKREFLRKLKTGGPGPSCSSAQLLVTVARHPTSSPPPAPGDLILLFKALGLVFFAGEWGILESPVHCCKVTPVLA